MAEPPPPSDRDGIPAWIDRVVDIAGALGMNRVQVRWKLQRRVNDWRVARNRRNQALVHVRYQHRVCPHCTAVNDRGASACNRCQTPLQARALELFGRLGVHVPVLRSASALLGLAIVIVYGRTVLAGHGGTLDIPASVLVGFGGNLPVGADGGEWWRVATAVFLHAGLWHLAFNLLSLANVGPLIEELYGRGVAVFLFMATGIAASIGSRELGLDGVGIGASGAVMGLIGVAAAAGHRSGTTRGRAIRNGMLRWAVYVLVAGHFLGADNRAHAVGLVAGVLFALIVPTTWLTLGRGRRVRQLLGAVGIVTAFATVAAALIPVSASPLSDAFSAMPDAFGLTPAPGDIDEQTYPQVVTQVVACHALANDDRPTVDAFGGAEALAEVCAALDDLRARCVSDTDADERCAGLLGFEAAVRKSRR